MIFIIILLAFFPVGFFATYFLTYLIHYYALAKNLIDIPNSRSSHSTPTPRGGGLSVVIVCLAVLWLSMAFSMGDKPEGEHELLLEIAPLVAIAGIGFWDDHCHIPAPWRLLVHFGASALVLMKFSQLPTIVMFGFSIDNQWLLGFLYLFGWVWLINLYNFMDGIDGIASVETITVALGAAVLLWFLHHDKNAAYAALIFFAGMVSGFLGWNFPPAKIFMGDVCSGFLGFSLGIFALMTSDSVNIWSWLILLGVFITDATFTLIKRILNKQIWYEAHSSHAYQHYARNLIQQFQQQGFDSHDARTQSHRRVNYQMTLINIFWLFPLASIATFYPYWASLITLIAYLPLIFIAQHLKAGSA